MSSTTLSTTAAGLANNAPQALLSVIQDYEPANKAPSADKMLEMETQYSLEGMPCHPVIMERGRGEYLWDTNGKQYIDFNAGFSSVNQGHCHPQIAKAMIEQCQKLGQPSRSVHNKIYGQACRKICDLTGFDKIAMTNGGAEAVDMAWKIARAWGYKSKGIPDGEALILTVEDNYHGRSLSVLSASNDGPYRKNQGPWIPNVGPYCAGEPVRFGVIEDLERAFRSHGPRIAAFMIEPVQGHAGCLAPPEGYLRRVRELCTEHNILFVADEIQAGLGRCGHFLSYQSGGIKPDMAILAKSLTGGFYPCSTVVGTKDAMRHLDPGQYGTTFSGNPIASAVAIAALDVIVDEKLPARAADLGAKFEARVRAFKSPYFDTITGMGLLRSIYLHETHPLGKVTGKRLAALCLERGLVVNASGRRLRLGPALVIDEGVMMDGLDILEGALDELSSLE